MKEPLKLRNYRAMFKRYYGIEFSNKYEVHHIDLNHENNDINNLMLLPRELHHRYHFYLNATNYGEVETYKRTIDVRIYGNAINKNTYERDMIQGLFEVLDECSIWYDYKNYLEGLLPNIHGIILE